MKKCFNITSHLNNSISNKNILSTPHLKYYYKRHEKQELLVKMWRKGNFYTFLEGMPIRTTSKLKIKLPHNPVNLFLNMQNLYHRSHVYQSPVHDDQDMKSADSHKHVSGKKECMSSTELNKITFKMEIGRRGKCHFQQH